MPSSNIRSAQKTSTDIISLRYLQYSAWCGVRWFAAPKQDQTQCETGAFRACLMAAAGVGGGVGVKSQEQV